MKAEPRGGIGYLLIGQPAMSSLVARALATKGDQPQFLEGRYELGVTALDLSAFEYRWLRRQITYDNFSSSPAVAAQFSYVQAVLQTAPFGRTVMAIIESVILANNSAARLGYFLGVSNTTVGSTPSAAGYGADDRALQDGTGAINPSLVLAQAANAASPMNTRCRFVSVPAGASMEVAGPWILTGKNVGTVSSSFLVVGDTVNVAVNASLRWSEREMMASEL